LEQNKKTDRWDDTDLKVTFNGLEIPLLERDPSACQPGRTVSGRAVPTIPNGALKGPYGWHPPTGLPGAEAFGEPIEGAAPASFLTINRQPDGGVRIAHHGRNRAERRHPRKGAARRLHFGR
jgi:hypothetical protein